MNPLHLGHAQLLRQATERLDRAGFRVVGAWLSPSHDAYVQPKAKHFGAVGLSAEFRLEVARRMVLEDPLIAVGAWEAQRPGSWPDFPEVCEALQSFLAESDCLPG